MRHEKSQRSAAQPKFHRLAGGAEKICRNRRRRWKLGEFRRTALLLALLSLLLLVKEKMCSISSFKTSEISKLNCCNEFVCISKKAKIQLVGMKSDPLVDFFCLKLVKIDIQIGVIHNETRSLILKACMLTHTHTHSHTHPYNVASMQSSLHLKRS